MYIPRFRSSSTSLIEAGAYKVIWLGTKSRARYEMYPVYSSMLGRLMPNELSSPTFRLCVPVT